MKVARTRPDRLGTGMKMTAQEYIALICGKLILYAQVQRKDELRTPKEWASAIKNYRSTFD